MASGWQSWDQLGKNVEHWATDPVKVPYANAVPDLLGLGKSKSSPSSSSSGGGPGPNTFGEPATPASTSPVDVIQQYMNAYGGTTATGQTPQQVYNYLAAADPQALKSSSDLQSALNKYSQYAGWTPAGSSGGNAANAIDPLAVQMFFQNTIAPYLNQVAGSEAATSKQLANEPTVQGLPASYAAVVKQGEQTQSQDMDALQQATLAAGATQPQVTLLNQMLGLAQKASLQDYYRQLESGIGGTATPAPTGGY
jgi:hypothetical protein